MFATNLAWIGEMWEVCSCSGRGRARNRESRTERSLNLSFFFFSVSACSCFQLHLPDPNPCFKKGPHHPSAAQTYRGDRGIAGGFARCSARSSPDVASCCSSGAIQGRQLMQPCSAGLQCSAEGAGNATVTNDLLIM